MGHLDAAASERHVDVTEASPGTLAPVSANPAGRISPYAGRSVLRSGGGPVPARAPRDRFGGSESHDGGTLDGPWEQAFWFHLPGPVRSKSNYRFNSRASTLPSGSDAWDVLADYESRVGILARRFVPDGWVLGPERGAVAARPVIVVASVARSLLDTGNIDKSVLDALQGVAMRSDAQVAWATSANIRSSKRPGLLTAVARLAPGTELDEQLAAGQQLAAAAVTIAQARLEA